MKISSVLDILDGELLNSPSISFINKIRTDCEKVKEGDLFFANTQKDIEKAVQNGAFAIAFENNFPIIDTEIAWIKVKSIRQSIIKLLRFKLSNLNLNAYFCEEVNYDLLKLYQNSQDKTIYFVSNNIERNLKYFEDIKDDDILISKDKIILDSIYPKNSVLEEDIDEKDITNLIEHSLFETSFSYKNHYFSRIKLSSLYLKNFINVYTFLNQDIDLSKLKSYKNMKALFLDKNLEPIEFGKSDRFIICQNSPSLVENEANYIKTKFKYAKSIFLCKNDVSSFDELKSTLKNIDFNCAYLEDFEYKEVLDYFIKSKKLSSLF